MKKLSLKLRVECTDRGSGASENLSLDQVIRRLVAAGWSKFQLLDYFSSDGEFKTAGYHYRLFAVRPRLTPREES